MCIVQCAKVVLTLFSLTSVALNFHSATRSSNVRCPRVSGGSLRDGRTDPRYVSIRTDGHASSMSGWATSQFPVLPHALTSLLAAAPPGSHAPLSRHTPSRAARPRPDDRPSIFTAGSSVETGQQQHANRLRLSALRAFQYGLILLGPAAVT